MAKRFLAPLILRIASWVDADKVARNADERIRELAAVPLINGSLIRDIVLEDGVSYDIAHGLGRKANVMITPPRGPTSSGRIEEVDADDPKTFIRIKATGWTVAITVNVWVF